jgi:hypothetical protein
MRPDEARTAGNHDLHRLPSIPWSRPWPIPRTAATPAVCSDGMRERGRRGEVVSCVIGQDGLIGLMPVDIDAFAKIPIKTKHLAWI